MAEQLFSRVNVPGERTHIPDGMARELALECQAYEDQIRQRRRHRPAAPGARRQRPHRFNEPSSSLRSRTRVIPLTASTAAASFSALPAGARPPQRALTMGVGTILEARRLLLLAFGAQ